VLESVTLPRRFHAQILAHAVMTQQNWRVHPTPEQLPQGRTRVWMAEAPRVEVRVLVGRASPKQANG